MGPGGLGVLQHPQGGDGVGGAMPSCWVGGSGLGSLGTCWPGSACPFQRCCAWHRGKLTHVSGCPHPAWAQLRQEPALLLPSKAELFQCHLLCRSGASGIGAQLLLDKGCIFQGSWMVKPGGGWGGLEGLAQPSLVLVELLHETGPRVSKVSRASNPSVAHNSLFLLLSLFRPQIRECCVPTWCGGTKPTSTPWS